MATEVLPMPAAAAPTSSGGRAVFKVNRKQLLQEISLAHSVLETKTTLPVLSNIILRAAVDPAQITILATDLDQSLQTTCDALGVLPGTAAVPGRKLYDYMKLLESEEISFAVLDNHWIQIRSGRSRTKMVGQDPSSYPNIHLFPDQITARIPVGTLRTLFGRTSFAADTNDANRFALQNLNFTIRPDSITAAASNGHHMSCSTIHGAIEGITETVQVLIPNRSAKILLALFASTEEESVDFAVTENNLFFRLGKRVYSTRKPAGAFPDFTKAIPSGYPVEVAVSVREFSEAIQRVSQFSDEKSRGIRFTLQENQIRVSSGSTDNGESEDAVVTSYSGQDLVIGINGGYLLSALKVFAGGEVRLCLKDGSSALMIKPEKADASYEMVYVVMPMKLP